KIVKMNEVMAKKLNITPEDAIGKTCYELVHAADKPLDNCPHKQLLEDGLEHTIETYEGRLNGYYLVTTSPLTDSNGIISGAVHLARDVSYLKSIQNALTEENEKNKAILMAIGDGLTIQDFDYRIIYQNQNLKDVFGDCVGRYCYEAYANSGQVCDDCPLRESFKDGKIHRSTRKVVTPDGRIIFFDNVASPIRDATGKIISAIELTRDITEHKLLEENLSKRTKELEELTCNLEIRVDGEIKNRLQKEQMLIQQSKMAAMGEMIAAIAHQWKQPLNNLGILIQDIRDAYRFGELDDAYIDTSVEKSMREVHFMAGAIEDFKNFFKPSATKDTSDVIVIASDVLTMLKDTFNKNSISYNITCHLHNKTFTSIAEIEHCDAALITTYKSHLAHVILNIINNAKEAIIQRKRLGLPGVSEEGMIRVDFYKKGETLKLSISDNGGGIPEEIMDKIFAPYFTTKSAGEGTGIGLYMSKIIMEEKLGGRIYVMDIEGGAEFTIELPV
ncbi:MAG: PAS domain-containing protein, partial [Nitrospirae bacterium]|nr:PAS domain-containing protein [Nitrospirota bacterium]